MVHKRRFVVFFFLFFFSKTKRFASKDCLRKESAPPLCRTYFLSRFWRRRGPARGALPFLFCFFFAEKNEGETFFFGPRIKKKGSKKQKSKNKKPIFLARGSREVAAIA